jgi:hypothetical protein
LIAVIVAVAGHGRQGEHCRHQGGKEQSGALHRDNLLGSWDCVAARGAAPIDLGAARSNRSRGACADTAGWPRAVQAWSAYGRAQNAELMES